MKRRYGLNKWKYTKNSNEIKTIKSQIDILELNYDN